MFTWEHPCCVAGAYDHRVIQVGVDLGRSLEQRAAYLGEGQGVPFLMCYSWRAEGGLQGQRWFLQSS